MKSARFSLWLVLALLLASSGNVCQAAGWSLPNLWPFSQQKTKAKKTTTKTANWPKFNMIPVWPTASKTKSTNHLSMFDRFAEGSKKMWVNTKKLVMPGSGKSFPWFSSKSKASHRASRSKKKSSKKPALFSRFFRPDQPASGPQTTKEFLSQKRLRP